MEWFIDMTKEAELHDISHEEFLQEIEEIDKILDDLKQEENSFWPGL